VLSRRIVNASPLILLCKAGLLDLLRLGGVDVVTPDGVSRRSGPRESMISPRRPSDKRLGRYAA
jgi:hypothetical protein